MRTVTHPRCLAVAAGALLAALTAFGALRVCPKCGYENTQAARACVHCKAELPGPKARPAPAEPETEPEAPAPATPVPSDVVDEEIALGQKYLKTDADLARLFFKNAMALGALAPADGTDGRAGQLVRLLRQTEMRGKRVRRKCPVCGGTGKRVLKSVSTRGEVTYQNVHGQVCLHCGGAGHVMKAGTVDERKYRLGRAQGRYRELQMARNFAAVGQAWVPSGVAEQLSVRNRVSLKKATAMPCPECTGMGCVDCDECKGTGDVECPNRRCDSGMVKVEARGRLLGKSMERLEKCRTCRGRGAVNCPDCRGGGTVLCRECNGTGERPVCSRCGGDGLAPCTRCRGSGVYRKAPCPYCGQEGLVECPSCRGDGRKKR
jgi:hypothetical protein